MSRVHKKLPYGRTPATRSKAPRYLVVTNGEVTECEYFRMLNRILGSSASFAVKSDRADPKNLADYAEALCNAEEASASDAFAKVFVVTDTDEFTTDQFQKAQALCDKRKFMLVVSNPCFEVWLIDHVEVCRTADGRTVKQMAAKLGIERGERKKEPAVELLESNVERARDNAAVHNTDERRAMRESFRSLDFAPWTDMPEVVDELGIATSL